ncbi:MAG: RICIN domain-containing protein [Ruminococcus sp.]|nr:RICIN domain-containing protein [Ruminococcus sp.]
MLYKKIISAVLSVCTAVSVGIFLSGNYFDKTEENHVITADSAFKSDRLYNQWHSEWGEVTFNKYSNTNNSLLVSGCGVFAFCNAIYALNGTVADPVEVATWAVNIGALQPGNGGTYNAPFYNNVQSAFGDKFGFYLNGYYSGKVTDSRLISHLMDGGVAVVNVPGHFMAITGYNPSNNTYHLIESAVSRTRGASPDSWVSAEKMSSGNTNVSWYALLSNSGTANRVPTAQEYQEYKLENFGNSFCARIKNPSTDRYIANSLGNAVGKKAEISDNQVWKFRINSDRSYSISSAYDGKYISLADNSDIVMSEYNGGNSQKFHIYSKDGRYYIKPVGADCFINMAVGSGNVELSINPDDLPPQEFDIIGLDLEEIMPADVGDHFSAIIRNRDTESVLTAKDGEVSADIEEYDGSNIWNFTRNSDGSYTINTSEKNFMTVADYDNAREGADIRTEAENGGNSQKYYIYKISGEYCYIRSVGSDLYVNVSGSTWKTDMRGYVTMWSPQMFAIEKIVRGDLNNNGKVDSEDAMLIKEWLIGKNVEINIQNADLSGDGVVDSFDLAMFKRIIVEEKFSQIKQNLIDIYIYHRTK